MLCSLSRKWHYTSTIYRLFGETENTKTKIMWENERVFFSNDYFRISVLWVGILTLPGFPTADADDCLTLISIIVAVAQYKDCIVDTRVDSTDNMLL